MVFKRKMVWSRRRGGHCRGAEYTQFLSEIGMIRSCGVEDGEGEKVEEEKMLERTMSKKELKDKDSKAAFEDNFRMERKVRPHPRKCLFSSSGNDKYYPNALYKLF